MRRLRSVWTYLQNWIVQDGEIPELTVGDQVRDVGIRLYYDRISTEPEMEARTAVVATPTTRESYRYTLTGTITRPTGGVFSDTVLDSEAGYFFLEPESRLETHSLDAPQAAQLPAGTIVSVSGTTEIMAYYEVDGHSTPLVRDRTVHDLAVERRALVPETDNVNISRPGEIIEVETIARMRKWDDDQSSGREHVTYLLRLDPPLNLGR